MVRFQAAWTWAVGRGRSRSAATWIVADVTWAGGLPVGGRPPRTSSHVGGRTWARGRLLPPTYLFGVFIEAVFIGLVSSNGDGSGRDVPLGVELVKQPLLPVTTEPGLAPKLARGARPMP